MQTIIDDVDVLNLYYPIENISPFEETPSFDDPPTTSPNFDPDVQEHKVNDPTLAYNSTPKTALHFICKLQNATSDSNIEPLDSDPLKCICNPPARFVDLTLRDGLVGAMHYILALVSRAYSQKPWRRNLATFKHLCKFSAAYTM